MADSYRKIIEYFEPQFLLGITATPERMDQGDVLGLFDQNMPYELRLRDAIINGLVVPFKYYGIRDELIAYGINETKGHKFVEQFSDDSHCEFIVKMIENHRLPGQKLKALAFCRDISHARRMAQAMEDYYHTCVLTGKNSVGERVRAYIDDVNFNTKVYLQQDYLNFKKYISSAGYPQHVDYLNNDYAPDLIKFMQSKINGRKNASYYGFLKSIDEENLPAFNERQEEFSKYVSEMLPIVRPYEYLILQRLIYGAGEASFSEIEEFVCKNTWFSKASFDHALFYMLKTGFFISEEGMMKFDNIKITVELDEYLCDLLSYLQ